MTVSNMPLEQAARLADEYARRLRSINNHATAAGVEVLAKEIRELAPRATGETTVEAALPKPRLLAIEALEAVTNYFWGIDGPVLSEGEVQQLVEVALGDLKARSLDEGTLKWAAQWITDSLTGETDERVIEFAKNMAMTIRAATRTEGEGEKL